MIYLTDQKASVRKTLKGANDVTLTGYGLNPAILQTLSGSDAKLLRANDSDLLMLQTGSTAGMLTVAPTIDGQPLDLAIKPESEIDELKWRLGEDDDATVAPIETDQDQRKGYLLPECRVVGARVCDADGDTEHGGRHRRYHGVSVLRPGRLAPVVI